MFKIEDIERAREIVKGLDIPYQFGSHEDDDDITNNFIYEQLEEVVGCDYFVTNGVSKLVIVVDDLPFVIKIPFNGRWVYFDDYEDEGNEGEEFCEFTQADDYMGDNYCAVEMELTSDMEAEGFGALVPDMMYLCTVCGKDIFIQEKVKPVCECRREIKPSLDSLNKAKKVRSLFLDEWLGLMFDVYGENYYYRFIQWARECKPEIVSDCHTGNYGISMDGRPVIFDISGFRD